MQRRKTGRIWLWGLCALMSIPLVAMAADQLNEPVTVASLRNGIWPIFAN